MLDRRRRPERVVERRHGVEELHLRPVERTREHAEIGRAVAHRDRHRLEAQRDQRAEHVVVGGLLDRHGVARLGEEPERERDALGRALRQRERVGRDVRARLAEMRGQHLAEPGVPLRASVAEELGALVRQHAVQRAAELVDGVERRIRQERVERHGVRARVARARALEVLEPLHGRREARLERRRARLRRDLCADERAAPDRRLDEPLAGERLVGERHRVAVHAELGGERADRRKALAGGAPARRDVVAQPGRDLPVEGLRLGG